MAPEPRPAEADEFDRLREIARSSFTTSYSLSPGQIDAVLDTEFDEENFERMREDDAVLLAAEVDDVVAGVVQGTVTNGRGEVRWLHVDPERRGAGAGTALYEAAAEELRQRGADIVYGATLAANAEGNMFFEKMGLVQVEEREVEIGGEELVEHVFAEESEVGEEAESEAAERDVEEEESPPETVSDEGREVHVGAEKDDRMTGTEAPFYRTYTDEERTEPYGLYCANCGSTDVEMNDMERVKCGECGNERRADEEYDASYL